MGLLSDSLGWGSTAPSYDLSTVSKNRSDDSAGFNLNTFEKGLGYLGQAAGIYATVRNAAKGVSPGTYAGSFTPDGSASLDPDQDSYPYDNRRASSAGSEDGQLLKLAALGLLIFVAVRAFSK